eukprot:6470370-Amphidinium_carterae.1
MAEIQRHYSPLCLAVQGFKDCDGVNQQVQTELTVPPHNSPKYSNTETKDSLASIYIATTGLLLELTVY